MKRLLLPVAAIAMLVLGACAGTGNAGTGATQSGPAKATVTMTEWTVNLSQTTLPAGKVTISLKNDGKLTHEMAILKTDLPHDKIPARVEDASKVQEIGIIGEIEDVEAGTTKADVFDLVPGNYVLICNEVAHYMAGMHLAFVVK
jgi:uncharacterized cupredoxin-like copper-binding protein